MAPRRGCESGSCPAFPLVLLLFSGALRPAAATVVVPLEGPQTPPPPGLLILACKPVIQTFCHDAHSQGEVVACLEKALTKEAEGEPRMKVSDECKKAILRMAELSSVDFHLDRHLYFACRDDWERFCENCGDALTTRQKLFAQDYKVSYSLAKSCKSDLKKYRCNVDNLPRSQEPE